MNEIWLTLGFVALMATGREPSAKDPGTPIGPTSRIWITGSSNIRRFTCRARQLGGTLRLHGLATTGPVLSGHNAASEPSLSVSVDRLECGIGAMNRHLREALHGTEHPVITFRLASYDVDLTATTPVARVTGDITVAGVVRTVTVNAAIADDSLGLLHVRGTHVVRMSDFGLVPPRRFGGLLRVRDHIVVHFDVALGRDCGVADGTRCALAAPAPAQPNSGACHVSHD